MHTQHSTSNAKIILTIKARDELKVIESPTDAHTLQPPQRRKPGEIQRQPRHIESFLQWKAEFRAKLLLKPGNSEKSKAKASAHIHH